MLKVKFKNALTNSFLISESTANQMIDLIDKAKQDNFTLGRYSFDEGIFANVEEYQTKENSLYERHEKYADIQVVTKGKERIILAPLDGSLREVKPYDNFKDIAFLKGKQQKIIPLQQNDFLIILPNTAHMPCINDEGTHTVRKLVFKIPKELIK